MDISSWKQQLAHDLFLSLLWATTATQDESALGHSCSSCVLTAPSLGSLPFSTRWHKWHWLVLLQP